MHIIGSPDISVLGVLVNSAFIMYVANPIPPSSSSVAPIRNNDNSPSPLTYCSLAAAANEEDLMEEYHLQIFLAARL